MKLGTIKEEETACRKAWEGFDWNWAWAWHLHHQRIAEALTEPIENRISYILSDKPEGERALRLRLMRPVRDVAAIASAQKAYDAAYDAAIASAQKAYDAATAPAQKAYDAARASAQKAYDAATTPAHSKECPGCPWDTKRRTIFR